MRSERILAGRLTLAFVDLFVVGAGDLKIDTVRIVGNFRNMEWGDSKFGIMGSLCCLKIVK